ncbi:MAG: patatin-like phospholipase family protein [Vicinamibacteria bacterium]
MPIRLQLTLLVVFAGATVRAQDPPPPEVPRVALALSGGGARGIAHIGVLRALEEGGIPVDALAANSIGAVVGGIYATGRSADELERVVRSLDWASLFTGRPDRRTLPVVRRVDRLAATAGVGLDWKRARLPAGLIGEHRVNRFLIEQLAPAGYAAGGDFDRLAIPFRAIAGDLATGEPVVLAKGDLARAVRASMSIPLLFAPVEADGRRLVDGLIVNNLPKDVARRFGAAVVIAVDVASPPMLPEKYESALGVAAQVTDVLTRRRYQDFAAEADVSIRPDLGRHASTDYDSFDELIRKGYEATRAALPAIREQLAARGVTDLRPRRAAPPGPVPEGVPIAAVRVAGNRKVSERLALRTFNVPLGPPFEMERGLRAFDKASASALFERTWLELEPAAPGLAVVLRVQEAPANRAEVGVGYTEWEKARGAVRLRNQNTFGFGEEVEALFSGSDALQRIELSLRGERLFLSGLGHRVTAHWNVDKPRSFSEDGREVNRARFRRDGVEAALHSSIERWGLVEAGVRFGRVRTDARAGLAAPAASDRVGAVFAQVALDTLDDRAWPEHGQRIALEGDRSLDGLGADRVAWRVSADADAARALGSRLVAQASLFAGFSGRDLPAYDWYRIGGTRLVPGYHHEELKGRQAFAGSIALRVRLIGHLRAVGRVGAGEVFDRARDVTPGRLRWGAGAGLYHPSPIGPVALEVGVRAGGATLTALSVGWN